MVGSGINSNVRMCSSVCARDWCEHERIECERSNADVIVSEASASVAGECGTRVSE